ncbi:MAG TPA: hypothetical protein VF116_18720 [Ktedonobacterales bacterium]
MNLPAAALAGGEDPRDTGAHPAHPQFWARRGAGHGPLVAAAWLHALAGAIAAASCLALGYRTGASQRSLLELALVGGAVTTAGLLAVLLALPRASASALLARALLPGVDLAAAVAAYWLLGDRNVVLPLFMVPAAVACALLSWRGGVIFAALSQAGYCTLAALRMGPALDAWVPQTLVLAGLLLIQTGSLGFYLARVEEVTAALQVRLSALRRDRMARAAEQSRLLDGLTLVEETQARLEHERVQVNTQVMALVSAAQRLADGDPSSVQALARGMYGPLDLLTAALVRLAARPAVSLGVVVRPVPAPPEPSMRPAPLVALPAPSTPSSPSLSSSVIADDLGDALREQGRLLTAADTLLRDLGIRANELMAAAQEARQGASSPRDGHADALDAALRDIERLARDQSAGAATLGSRLAQLLVRQSDLDAVLHRAVPVRSEPLAASGVTPLWPPASGSTSSSGSSGSSGSAGGSPSRHIPAWEPSQSVSRVASGPLR